MTTLAEVLDGHYPAPIVDGSIIDHGCCCGWASGLSWKSGWGDAHSEHIAQVIRDHLTALAGDAGVREVVVRALEDETGRQMLAAWKGEIPAESVEFDFPADADAAVAAFLGCVE